MKKHLILLLFLSFLTACSSDDDKATTVEPKYDSSVALNLTDVAYGSDPEQLLDIYLPAGRDTDTKVIILVHGGAWIEGDKADFAEAVAVIRAQFPDYGVVNINYRLATPTSPAYPKQIDDIKLVIDHLENGGYVLSNDYAFLGASAGAHLSMLYSYKYDTDGDVKAIVDIVGPADFTDPNYLSHPLYSFAAQALIGTQTPTSAQIAEVSPANYIKGSSAPTLSFYGGVDPLVPASQGPLLKAKLDAAGVYNEFNFYEDGGHGDWDTATFIEVYAKIEAFLKSRF
ncbi:alpha/beta hydrolase [Flavobacterium subsaxonicum]|uniref:BD-FAE-like domain-containing protein n=1 Tax=Flavobacterium subsaxonicum WB 4.1-42 = DSM 21790 TaxID=1121898 RepID=A0A0A2MPZ0_9FLAO|nr:alpha/beta hydrolase [Flavobacterium subsaxonicum]KGO93538.1 hypothetical protein Q766_06090 [Flavobacterium subsaxonicum WB 4.1-42 = DSM 21790]